MEKTGWHRLPTKCKIKEMVKCMNCGRKGVYRVTFEDMYGKLTVTLCEDCSKLRYGQLKLQSRFE